MNLSKDECHICLETITIYSPYNSPCVNPDCSGFICKKCWEDLIIQADTCPLCRDDLSTVSILKHIHPCYSVTYIIKHLTAYLLFYSMGTFVIWAFISLFKYDINMNTPFVTQLFILSLISNPIVGILSWLFVIIGVLHIVNLIRRCLKHHCWTCPDQDNLLL